MSSKEHIEIIFVDQSESVGIKKLFAHFDGVLRYKLVESTPCSLSQARNIGLEYATGFIVGFCDDDAYYPESFFIDLIKRAPYNEEVVLCLPVVDKKSMGFYGGRTFPNVDKEMSYLEVLRYSLSVGSFIVRNYSFDWRFNPLLGVGAKYGGSEETDFILQLKSNDFRTIYMTAPYVYHDNDALPLKDPLLGKKYFSYAVGYAVVLKKHMKSSGYSLIIEVGNVIFRSAAGVLLSKRRAICYNRLLGFIKGLLCFKL
ncbi:MAG: glycosyltransferase [Pseudomonas sp.]|nr:glycosyltransferase [Pseudomonas sp.]